MAEKLLNEFPPVTTQQWEEVIQKDLKGADYQKKLVWKTNEGFSVNPYYRAADIENLPFMESLPGQFPYLRGTAKEGNNWLIRQDFCVKNVEETNKKAVDAIARGAEAIGFEFENDATLSAEEFSKLLNGIDTTQIEVNFQAVHGIAFVLPLWAEYVKKNNIDPQKVLGSISLDPIGNKVVRGEFCIPEEKVFETVTSKINEYKNLLPKIKILAVNGKFLQNAGATAVQELGFSLAWGVEYISKLMQKGLAIEDIAPRIKFNFAAGSNYFMEIAKLRAARLLWAKIVEQYQPKCTGQARMTIHSETSKWNMTLFDPNVNMLRSTTEAMSATLGGVHSLTIHPFDLPYKKANAFSERVARNQQIILKEESNFDKVADPSAGSYYIETLTASVAEHAWKLFQTVEEKGGFLAALNNGFVKVEIAASAQKRDSDIAQRREILLGTNQYPNFNEKMAGEIEKDNACQCKTDYLNEAMAIKPYRGAMAFEELRLKTEKSGKNVKVFMLTFGNLAMQRARSQFSSNFFACAGFQVVDNPGFKTIEEGIAAAIEAKADITVICSSDEEYATIVPEIYEKLNGKSIVVVAGAPACMEELKAKGVQNYIHIRSNVLETLKQYQSIVIKN